MEPPLYLQSLGVLNVTAMWYVIINTTSYSSGSRHFSYHGKPYKVSLILPPPSPKMSLLVEYLELEYIQIRNIILQNKSY